MLRLDRIELLNTPTVKSARILACFRLKIGLDRRFECLTRIACGHVIFGSEEPVMTGTCGDRRLCKRLATCAHRRVRSGVDNRIMSGTVQIYTRHRRHRC